MNLIKLDTKEYPVTLQAFKARFPNVSFADNPTPEDYGYSFVLDTPKPSMTRTQKAVEQAPVYTDAWRQTWSVVDLKDTELAAVLEQIASEEAEAQKEQAIIDNLPSWSQVSGAVDAISNLAEAKVFLKNLARIVYWLAKDRAD
jgi:hypothetical protein